MLGVLMCYIMLQMILQEGIRREKEEEEGGLIKSEEHKQCKRIKSLQKESA